MTVTLINPFEVALRSEDAFLESWKRTAAVFAGASGYLDTQLHRSLDPAARFRFVNVAHWTSPDAWSQAMTTAPPREREVHGIQANPALYRPVDDGTIGARSDRTADELRGLEEDLAAAYQANDTVALTRLLADDYVVTDGPGTTSDKRKVLDDHAARRLQVSRFAFDEMEVRRLGPEVAIVTGRYSWDATYAGHPIAGTFRYLRVYVRSAVGWQIKAGQVTPVLPPRQPAEERRP